MKRAGLPFQLYYVTIGGFLGAAGRYLVSMWVYSPLDTLLVNVLGSFLLGLLLYGSEYTGYASVRLRLLLGIGFTGAFTTFSTFIILTVQMEPAYAALNIAANILPALLGVYLARAGAIYARRRVSGW